MLGFISRSSWLDKKNLHLPLDSNFPGTILPVTAKYRRKIFDLWLHLCRTLLTTVIGPRITTTMQQLKSVETTDSTIGFTLIYLHDLSRSS
jgi:hypothetical protein